LWTGVQGERDRLGRLAESVNSVARRCHIKVDERPFRPHLTLARVREPGNGAGNGNGAPTGDNVLGASGTHTIGQQRTAARAAREQQESLPDLQPYVERMSAFRTPRWLVGEIDLFNVVDDPVKRYERVGRWALTGR
ncbi:MAG: 2'-5' RNA ligase family protein, partial [Actinocrinis sp.]